MATLVKDSFKLPSINTIIGEGGRLSGLYVINPYCRGFYVVSIQGAS